MPKRKVHLSSVNHNQLQEVPVSKSEHGNNVITPSM